MRAFVFRQLRRHRTDGSGCAGDQNALTGRELAVIENSLPRRQRGDWHRRRRIEIDLLRLSHELARWRRYILRVTATMRAEITINIIACPKALDAGPVRRSGVFVLWRFPTSASDRLHPPGHFAAKNYRELHPEHLS